MYKDRYYEESSELIFTQNVNKSALIDVRGIIDVFDGEYDIKIFSFNDITFH